MEPKDPYLLEKAEARVGFKMHLRSYLIINAGLWGIWLALRYFAGSTAHPWPLWAMLGWGIGLAAHYFSVYTNYDERSAVEREYEKLRQQR